MSWDSVGRKIRETVEGKGVLPSGPKDAKVVIVGEAPGEREVREGQPFVGRAGKMLRRVMREAELDPKNAFFTNAVPVRFGRGITGGDVSQWKGTLLEQIRLVGPRVVVAVGKVAEQALGRVADVKVPHPSAGRFGKGVERKILQGMREVVERLGTRRRDRSLWGD